MSAFVVNKSTMDKVVRAICGKNRYGQVIRQFDGIDTAAPNAPTEIGRRLFTLNVEAVHQRYPDTQDTPDNMPGPCDDDGRSVALSLARSYTAKKDLINQNWLADFKAMESLRYQCSEGDVPETPLYAELDRAIGEVACHIVKMTPQYEKAAW